MERSRLRRTACARALRQRCRLLKTPSLGTVKKQRKCNRDAAQRQITPDDAARHAMNAERSEFFAATRRAFDGHRKGWVANRASRLRGFARAARGIRRWLQSQVDRTSSSTMSRKGLPSGASYVLCVVVLNALYECALKARLRVAAAEVSRAAQKADSAPVKHRDRRAQLLDIGQHV